MQLLGSSLTFLVALSCAVSRVAAVPPYGQCGGQGYTGSTQCDSGTVCVKLNDWYSQCQPGAAPTSTSVPTAPTTTPSVPTSTTPSTPTSTAGPPATSIPAGQLTRLTANFGPNPKNVGIYVYKPTSVKNNPGLLVGLHGCGGNAQQFFSSTQFRSLADQRGFLVIYGSAANDMNCWDVTSNTSLTHDAGGDSLGLASAIRYSISEWGVDPSKVFLTGFSSGAMMTNVMAGAYPDLMKAGAAFAGVPMGCKMQSNGPVFPPDQCAAGQLSKSPAEWAEIAKRGYPGYTGSYPRMQLWHGTADNALDFRNLAEEVKQWTFIHGVSQTATTVQAGFPKSNWQKSVYGNGEVEGYVGSGNGHGLPEAGTEVHAIDFFGL